MTFASDAQRRWFFAHQDDENESEEQWANALTPIERLALEEYSHGGKWRDLNEAIRTGAPLTAQQARMAAALDTAIAKAPQFRSPKTLYRGVNFGSAGLPTGLAGMRATTDSIRSSVADWAEAEFPHGRMFSLGGYQSTSKATQPALDASLSRRSPGVVFRIRATRAAPLHRVARMNDESEYLLSRRTTYRSMGVTRSESFELPDGRTTTRTVVDVEQVGP